MNNLLIRTIGVAALCQAIAADTTSAQQVRPSGLTESGAVTAAVASSGSPRYVIGTDDILSITFWREQSLSGDVVVRPDGRISIPLLNDVVAAGFTPEQLASSLASAAVKFVDDPAVTVSVKEIHSRKVFLVGEVTTPGVFPLTGGDMNVLQLIAVGGGLREFADRKNIVIIRSGSGQEKRFKFNYDQVLQGKNTRQNVVLQPGDTIVVR